MSLETLFLTLIVSVCVFAALLALKYFGGTSERTGVRALLATNRMVCPNCGERYVAWNGGSWGVDDYPDHRKIIGGHIFECSSCGELGYSARKDDAIEIFKSIDDAADYFDREF